MVSPIGFQRVPNFRICTKENDQMIQFENQQYIFDVYFNHRLLQYVAERFDKNVRRRMYMFCDYIDYQNMTVRQFVSEVLNFGDSQFLIAPEEAHLLDTLMSQRKPVQFDILD